MLRFDLHGSRHEDVRAKLIPVIEENWNSGLRLQIITGKSVAMIGIVNEILLEYKLNGIIGHPLDHFNSGYITVEFE